MRILALETVGQGGDVAALLDTRVERRQTLPTTGRSAQTLAPAIHSLLGEVGWRACDIELVAVAVGPGSFTGLRIGVTTAKILAWAAGCPLVGVNTLEAIASRAATSKAEAPHPGPLPAGEGAGGEGIRSPALSRGGGSIVVALDAQRQQVFSARFSIAGAWTPPGEVVDATAWLASLEPGDIVTGPALERLVDRLPSHVTVAARDRWAPDVTAVGEVARRAFLAGQRDDPFQLVPLYLRRTAAEEQWERLGRA
jgi:tRNA threonylcarbamoyladenosine biosynthesis protein TsaB